MKQRLRWGLAAVCLAIFLFSGAQLYQYWQGSRQSKDVYARLSEAVRCPETDASEEEAIPWPEVDFQALREINSHVVGWITCQGTNIHYPVVQGENNDYYLTRLFDGSYNPSGSLFLDCRGAADFSDAHSIIYGHYMKNGTMFAALTGYKEQDFYQQHPQMLLITPEGRFVVELFSGYVASVEDSAWNISFKTEEEFAEWLEEITERSTFQSDILPSVQNQILTCSTCSYDFDNARFVVHGILREN